MLFRMICRSADDVLMYTRVVHMLYICAAYAAQPLEIQ